jgi:hypothetical protein
MDEGPVRGVTAVACGPTVIVEAQSSSFDVLMAPALTHAAAQNTKATRRYDA